ncbi:MAG: carbamoyltransferase HypF [Epsilonproteobacteria bacterium]|nr:carbamoyltransferase HypF [Campylobacterota bacterium]
MERYKIKIEGVVQGVGFRPFVYSIAKKHDIKGFVKNSSEGVFIEAEGTKESLQKFLLEFKTSLPPLAKIDKISLENIEIKGSCDFKIEKSTHSDTKYASISPDIAICEDCLRELRDKNDRRYGYYLINCTNCGPRYTIVERVPYDRKNTSMKRFRMCNECEKEYEDPSDRRYHAQPISCHKCGPLVKFYKTYKKEILASNEEAIKLCAKSIKRGNIVAVKGLGGFHIVCSATSPKSVKLLRKRKNRPTKPFAVMFKSIEEIKKVAILTEKDEELILSKEKPIVIVKKKEPHKFRKRELPITSFVAPAIDRIGVFLPYTPLHHLLFEYIECPIVATSANLSNEPIIRDIDELCQKLDNVADYVLDFNRDIINACDDSVVQAVNNKKETLRLARGYAPRYQKLPFKLKDKVLCVGANQKATITLAYEDILVTSPHIGDLGSIESMEYFERTIESFKRFYDFEPNIIVCDKHPSYETTKWAKEYQNSHSETKLFQVQHHYAHILSCMAEFDINEKVLGFSFDGTGYGDDGTIWGGEVFECDTKSYERIYHFKDIKLIGANRAIKEPKRVALAMLFEEYGLKDTLKLSNPTVKSFTKIQIKNLYTIWKNTTLKTSSLGRVFDGVASLCDILQVSNYEGESGLILESFYDGSIKDSFEFDIKDKEIAFKDLVQKSLAIMKENLNIKDKKRAVSTMFLNTLTKIILRISKESKLDTVVLSGGVFQNKTLLEMATNELEKAGKKVYFQQNTPINDGGISLGQAWWAVKNLDSLS